MKELTKILWVANIIQHLLNLQIIKYLFFTNRFGFNFYNFRIHKVDGNNVDAYVSVAKFINIENLKGLLLGQAEVENKPFYFKFNMSND